MDNFDYKKYLASGMIHNFDQINEKKEDSKKGNKEEQKRMEGAIRDDRDHIKNLKKDIAANEKKLAKLKKDFKKDVNESEEVSEKKYKQGYDDREDESLGARKGAEKDKKQSFKDRRDDSYGKFGKRDAEAKGKADGPGKNKVNKEELEVNEYGKKPMYDEDDKDAMKEDARTDAEQEGYEDGFKDAKKDMKDAISKMKVSELKAKIRETILAELTLAEGGFEAEDAGAQYHDSLYTEAEEDVDVDVDEKEEVDVDVDVEDEVKVDAEGDDIEIERPAVKAKVEVGLSPEEEIVQDSLKAAMDAADALGNDKLADQIGNTITFFTREYVVGRNTD